MSSAPSALRNRLVLHRFVCRAFGFDDMATMLARLRDAEGAGDWGQALYLNPARARVTPERLAEYEANIAAASRRLRTTGEDGRRWKPHQWLALLFTEHYLDRWFEDAEALRADLNAAKRDDRRAAAMPDYEAGDLRSLAFQSATGSGKTLLMHAHILLYRRRLDRAGGRLNNVVLVTPNERMSAQHERELRESGLHARLFSSEAGSDLLGPVEIVDLAKLAEKKGVKRVAVADFGPDNLVLVDEGHLGASGTVWRERRKELARGGFAFEYSATFNQIVGGDEALLHAYAKSILFDYPYRDFHAEGYGKDYAILNLPGGAEDENSGMYLLGCLLTFYQQFRLWRDKSASWAAYNPAKPLCAFLGKTVTGSSRADRETRSDVVRILRFLGRTLARGEEARAMIARLLAGESGLLAEDGGDWFAGRFPHLPDSGEDLWADMRRALFHGPGRMRVVYTPSGGGELRLRTADNPPFGVVNVGDSQALYRLLAEAPEADFDAVREMGFVEPLFADVDRPDSPVNVVIGARRFVAGWNSWRVSTMGLMHVGVGEGPEIVQMFGRGVRLKGWNTSLKRHGASGGPPPEDPRGLAELETLRIFGLRASYMQTFRDLLAKEGMTEERAEVKLPVVWNFARVRGLKTIRLQPGARYDRSGETAALPPPDGAEPPVEIDLYSRLQTAASDDDDAGMAGAAREPARIDRRHAAFFDRARVYDQLLERKRHMGWDTLAIARETVDRLLDDDGWYVLYAPPERLAVKGVEDLRALEALAVDLIAAYADRFWRKRRRAWEYNRIEAAELDEADPNAIDAYRLSVDAADARLAADVRELAETVRAGPVPHLRLSVVMADAHAYEPLLHALPNCKVTIRPVALDDAEKAVVERLAALAESGDPRLRGRELYLIRNLTRGRGVSFFDDFAYYPDFIVWLKREADQHVVFLDPKGLGRFGPKERAKIRLHAEIGAVEEKLRAAEPGLRLRAYVLSTTPPREIGGAERTREEWEGDGVYFLEDPDCLGRVVAHALGPEPVTGGAAALPA